VKLLDDVRMYAGFARALGPYLRHTVTLDEARAIVRGRLAERGELFLRTAGRGIYGHPTSPYLPLLRRAGCELGDLQRSVRTRGLEDTLRALRDGGVVVGFDQFKGRAPIVVDGVEHRVKAHDFDNPFAARHLESTTGGSTGAGTRIAYDLRHLTETTANRVISHTALGLDGLPTALWRPILPASSGLMGIVRSAKTGTMPRRWFTPVAGGELRLPLKYRLAMTYVLGTLRARGYRPPRPEPVPLDRADVVARWARDTARSEGRCVVRTSVSMALRVALAATERGWDLTGVTFSGANEPPTEAKVRGITRTGASYVTRYGMSEGGAMGPPCTRPADATDVHLCEDVWALILNPHRIEGAGAAVDAFCFTSLLPTAPKLMLNVETDDYGIVETRSCGCPLEEAGWRTHLRQIRSYKKLTGEGMTLVGNDMLRVLEEHLPARFGGSALDYQLREEEDERGFTRLTLVVSPRVRVDDEAAVLQALHEGIARGGPGAALTGAVWAQAGSVRLERSEPVWTEAGKLMPFRRVRAA
jgi:hypothetical protein